VQLWQPPDPPPTKQPPTAAPKGFSLDTPPFTHRGRTPQYGAVVYWPWIPPDPLPTLNIKLPPSVSAVEVDNPPFGTRRWIDAAIASWQPGPPLPTLNHQTAIENPPAAGGGKRRRHHHHPEYVPEDFREKKRKPERPIWDRKADIAPDIAPDTSVDEKAAEIPATRPPPEIPLDPQALGRSEDGRDFGRKPTRSESKFKLRPPKPIPPPEPPKPKPKPKPKRTVEEGFRGSIQKLEPPLDPTALGSVPEPEVDHEAQDTDDALAVLKGFGMLKDGDEKNLKKKK
jgi:hypothetical protein